MKLHGIRGRAARHLGEIRWWLWCDSATLLAMLALAAVGFAWYGIALAAGADISNVFALMALLMGTSFATGLALYCFAMLVMML